MKALKEIIREHRKLSRLSQAELAKLADVGKTVIFDLEHGKQTVQLDTLLKVLKALNISMRFESPILSASDANRTSPQELNS